MSTLPGLASKGEKGKSKYQSLDINSLYKVTLGESTEKQQQKSILSHKHGMQLLGKVPSARRPPANLPSLKSEHSGSDAAVSLVPSNGSGWGKQESASSSTSTTTTTNVSSAGAANATNTTSAHQANIALPVSSNPALQQQQQQQQHQQGVQQQIQQQQQQQQQSMTVSAVAGGAKQPHHQQQQQQQHGANPATGDKSWSSVMSGGEPSAHPPSYQSLMFEHEFPSLSAGDGGAPRSGTADTQYGPGPSLRPQTEGSWQLGGGAAARTDVIVASGAVAGPQRNGTAPHGAPPSHMGQGGPPLPQYRGFVPTFMYKGGNVAGNPAPGQQQPPYQNNVAGGPPPAVSAPPQQQSSTSNANNNATANNNSINQSTIRRHPQQQRNNQHHETDSSLHRPIIKEEELSGMDNLTSDMGWAMHDDIDYNQKLAFSDDEADNKSRGSSMPKDIQKSDYHHNQQQQQHAPQEYHQHHHQDYHHHQPEHKPWSRQQQQQSSMHSEEDDMNAKRRRQQQEVASARERARLRKEEEEKKFYQAKQNKYKDMDEKMQQGKQPPAKDDLVNAPAPAPILLPEWERPKESEQEQQQQQQQPALPAKNDFRQLTQIEGRATYTRKDQRSGGSSEKDVPSFKRQYQHNLPPRFQKRQQEQMNNGQQSSLSSSGGSGGGGFSFESNRWGNGGMSKTSPGNRKNHRNDNESEKDEDFNKYNYSRPRPPYGSGTLNSESSGRKSSGDDYEYGNRKDDNLNRQQSNEDWQERRMERYGSSDRPQRPDSRDSRASRESRHSEPRDYNSWAETHFEEDAKRHQQQQQIKEHKMQVPGPITKDKLEADDLRNEKQRNLTQLKRGAIGEMDNKKTLEKTPEKEDDPWSAARKGDMGPRAWADAISPSTVAPENPKFMMDIDKKSEDKMMSVDCEDKKDDKSKHANLTGRGRSDSQSSRSGNNNSTNGGSVYNRNMWSKKCGAVPPPRGGGGSSRSSISRSSIKSGGDWHASESEGSADDASTLQHHNEEQSQVSPKLIKKGDKDERNKDVKNDKSNAPSNCITSNISEKKPVGAGVGYVPRGEPSRHGRGGGGSGSSSFRGGRGGCKRMDGYGLPPVKSPFPHEEQQLKKLDSDEMMMMDDKKKLLDMNKRKDTLNKKKTGRDGGDVSDNSDDVKDKNRKPKQQQRQQQPPPPAAMPGSGSQRARSGNANSVLAPSPRISTTDKRGFSQSQLTNASMPRMKDDKGKDLVNAMTEMNLSEAKPESEQLQQPGDDGFQEVKSKKSLEKRPKSTEMKQQPMVKSQIDLKDNKMMMPTATKPKPVHNMSQQQIANIPSLMATPVNPPPNMPQLQSNKGPFERPRQNKLPPRLVKQRENNRLHKAQLQQQGLNVNEINDMNKMAQNMQQHYGMKDGGNAACNLGMVSAWEKPLGQLRDANANPDVLHALDINQKDPNCKQSTDGGDKVLDGSNPLKTIIFENTNYKSAPGCRNRNDKRGSGSKPSSLEDNNGGMEMNFGNKQIGELLNNKTNDKSDINMQLSFDADKAADIKLDFFENEISHLTEDKGSKNMSLPRTMHAITSSNNTISQSTADDLNIKIQSVKKVWEMPTVIEVQQQQQQQQQQDEAYSSSFGPDPNGMDQGFANKSGDGNDDNHEGYSPSANNVASNSNTTNVCKVKPTQQVAGSGGQSAVINTVSSGGSGGSGGGTGSGSSSSVGGSGSSGSGSGHQQHSTMVGPNLIGHPLSPPPQMPTVISALGPQPQQYTTNQHLGYQTAGLGGNTQYGIPAIPSPPTVLYNSTQQMPQSGLYGTFQLDQSQVLNNQGRSQYSQYSYGLGQTASSPYSAQSMYLQTQPHGPPTAQGPPDIYPNYRLSAAGPFGQNQQMNNPTTVLISSTSNSLMSATVKPSGQQISAIGTKAGGVGQAYQQQSQQGQQLYMTYDPTIQANYLQNTGVMQRGPPPPQNSVVPGLQPSSSYYSGSTVLCAGGQTAGYFQQPPPGNSSQMAPPPPQQHQAGYGLQGSVFGTHSQSPHTGNAGIQNFNSPFLSGPMMAMNAQQYRSAVAANMQPAAAVASYMKSSSQQMDQQGGRSQQLRSPGSQQEVLSSVFNTASQIPSPKSRQSCKQPQPQPSPTAPNKSGYLYQNVTNPPSGQSRYPAPIQRPNSNYGISSMQNNGQKHGGRPNNSGNRSASRQYYSSQGVGLNNQVDKSEDSKLVEGGANKLGAANQQPGGGASDKIDVGKDVENSAKD